MSTHQHTSETATATRTCDICQEAILPGEGFYPDATDDTYGEHKACTAAWVRRNFGRETLS